MGEMASQQEASLRRSEAAPFKPSCHRAPRSLLNPQSPPGPRVPLQLKGPCRTALETVLPLPPIPIAPAGAAQAGARALTPHLDMLGDLNEFHFRGHVAQRPHAGAQLPVADVAVTVGVKLLEGGLQLCRGGRSGPEPGPGAPPPAASGKAHSPSSSSGPSSRSCGGKSSVCPGPAILPQRPPFLHPDPSHRGRRRQLKTGGPGKRDTTSPFLLLGPWLLQHPESEVGSTARASPHVSKLQTPCPRVQRESGRRPELQRQGGLNLGGKFRPHSQAPSPAQAPLTFPKT